MIAGLSRRGTGLGSTASCTAGSSHVTLRTCRRTRASTGPHASGWPVGRAPAVGQPYGYRRRSNRQRPKPTCACARFAAAGTQSIQRTISRCAAAIILRWTIGSVPRTPAFAAPPSVRPGAASADSRCSAGSRARTCRVRWPLHPDRPPACVNRSGTQCSSGAVSRAPHRRGIACMCCCGLLCCAAAHFRVQGEHP